MAKLERTDKPVDVLIDELKKGELSLPEIQRGYVWNRPQARDLVDSLYREYPSGLILLWKSEELPVLRELDIGQGPQDKQPASLIIDGQQRLTSLSKIMDGTINVYFNVKDETFQLFSSALKGTPLWISVKEVLDRGSVKIWQELKNKLSQHALSIDEEELEKYLERLHRLERIKEYRYPVMIIHTDDFEEVAESFIRVNLKGTKLKLAELAMARLAFRWPGAIVNEFDSALDNYEQVNFDFEARFLMRCYVAIGTGQSRFRYLSSLWQKQPNELKEIWDKTKKGLDYTVNFLKDNAGIESSDWIPSLNALVPLVAYLSKKQGTLSENEEKLLLFWFFNATIQGRFSGSPETKIDQDLKAIKEEDSINALITNLKNNVSSFSITPEMIEGKYQTNSFLPLVFSIFRRNNAKDWFTGILLSSTNVGPAHRLEFHHVFPKGILKGTGDYTSYEIDDIANISFLSQKANRTILNSKPADYLKNIDAERLKAQLIPMDKALWEVNKFRGFLKERRRLITEAVNSYLSDLAPN